MSAQVVQTLEALSVTDVERADRAGLERAVRAMGDVRAWLDAFEVRCARRSRRLAADGRAAAPESTLTDRGRRSGKDAAEAAEREQLCSELPTFEEALAAGEVSAGHVDALARATKRLDDATRDAVKDVEAELLAAARQERVETFERRVREEIKRIEARQARSDADELDRQRASSTITRWTDKRTGMCHTHLELDPLRDRHFWSIVEQQVQRSRQDPATRRKPWAQLQIDTLLDTLSNGAGSTGAGAPGGDHACRCDTTGPDPSYRVPEATVLADLGTLVHGLHANSICELDDGTPIPISAMRRMLCDCEVLPVVLNGRGEALDAGRSERTATRPQRRALRAMHRTCAHPGCTVPFNHCRIHHVRWWWRHLGPTDLDNLIPLCEVHHHLVHEGGWTLAITPDRIATWTRPDGTIAHTGSCIDRAPTGVGVKSGRAEPGRSRSP